MPVADAPAQQAPAQRAPAHRAQARLSGLELRVFRAVNRARGRRGLPRLRLNLGLTFVAKIHSRDQVVNRFISHSSSNGAPFYSRIGRVVDARTVGETIAEFRGRSAGRRVVRTWLRSPAHRRELLNPRYRQIGVGHASMRGLSVVTADFASAR